MYDFFLLIYTYSGKDMIIEVYFSEGLLWTKSTQYLLI